MANVRVFYDRVGHTLDVWFTKPQKAICEEAGHGLILKKNKRGRIIGFEQILFMSRQEALRHYGKRKAA